MSWWQIVFGKLLQDSHADAAIVPGFEHQIIGQSVDVPDGVLAACYPSVTGIGTTELDPWDKYPWRHQAGGLILCPLILGQQAYTVVGRIGCRREQGQQGRYYTQAYYLVAPVGDLMNSHLWHLQQQAVSPMLTQVQNDLPLLEFPLQDIPLPTNWSQQIPALLSTLLKGQPIHRGQEENPDDFLNQAIWLFYSLPPAIRWRISLGHCLYRIQPETTLGQGYLLTGSASDIQTEPPYLQPYLEWFSDWSSRVQTLAELQSVMTSKLKTLGLSHLNHWNGLDIQLPWTQVLSQFGQQIAEYSRVEQLVMWMYDDASVPLPAVSASFLFFQEHLLHEILEIPEFLKSTKFQNLLPLFAQADWASTWNSVGSETQNLSLQAIASLLGHSKVQSTFLSELLNISLPKILWESAHTALLPFLKQSLQQMTLQTEQDFWKTFLTAVELFPDWLQDFQERWPELWIWLLFHHLERSESLKIFANLTSPLSRTLYQLCQGKNADSIPLLLDLLESLRKYQLHPSDGTDLLKISRQNQQAQSSLSLYCALYTSLPFNVVLPLLQRLPEYDFPVVDWLLSLKLDEHDLTLPALNWEALLFLEDSLMAVGRHYTLLEPRLSRLPQQPEELYTYLISLTDNESLSEKVADKVLSATLHQLLSSKSPSDNIARFWVAQNQRFHLSTQRRWQIFINDTQSTLQAAGLPLVQSLEPAELLSYFRRCHPMSAQLLNQLELSQLFSAGQQINQASFNQLITELQGIQHLLKQAQHLQAQRLGERLVDYLILNYAQPNHSHALALKIKHFKSLEGIDEDSSKALVLTLFIEANQLAGYTQRQRLDRISELTRAQFSIWSKWNWIEKTMIVTASLVLVGLLVFIVQIAKDWWQSPSYIVLTDTQAEISKQPLYFAYLHKTLSNPSLTSFKIKNFEPLFDSLANQNKGYQFRLPTPEEAKKNPLELNKTYKELVSIEGIYYLCTHTPENQSKKTPSKTECKDCNAKCLVEFELTESTSTEQGIRMIREKQ